MTTLILRRRDADAPSPAEAAGVVESLPAAVVHRSERMLLVDVANEALVEVLCDRLHGWVVSRQGPRIQLPDTRLRLKSDGK
jgi:hypothetical protein